MRVCTCVITCVCENLCVHVDVCVCPCVCICVWWGTLAPVFLPSPPSDPGWKGFKPLPWTNWEFPSCQVLRWGGGWCNQKEPTRDPKSLGIKLPGVFASSPWRRLVVCSLANTFYENVVLGIWCAQDPVLSSGGCSGGHEGPPEISHHTCQVTRGTHRKRSDG